MNTIMEPNIIEIDPLNQTGQLMRKENDLWFADRHANIHQQQQSIVQPPCYKYQNTIGLTNNFNDAPRASWWWKNGSTLDTTQSEHQHELNSTSNYPLNDRPLSPQTINDSQESESVAKNPIKSKQSRKPRLMEERRSPVKRTKHPEQWKVNIKKNARLRGEEYVGVGGKIVPAKTMGPPCSCRMHCTEKVEEAARKELHDVFWKTCTWEQRKQYIALSVKESPKQRTRCRGNVKSEHRRQVTFTYSLLLKGEFTTVCKSMFLSTFAVSEKFVRHAMDKKRTSPGGIIGPDQRERLSNTKDGKRYLDSRLSIATMHKLYVLKCQEDGVPESDVVKESYYREMFKTEFNLGFKPVKNKEKKQ
ncbi:hypothetical protein KM043_015840 [Ampulex compressa]|nr:hypothetical protein KM043_015840 [Ampulex compressa]